MRAIFIGASATALAAVRKALEKGHEAVVVERDAALVEDLAEELDASFVVADGSRPAVLKDLSPENADALYCLTSSDHDNIIAGLVARALGYERVVVRIDDADLEPICTELGLKDLIVPAREVGHALVDLLEGRERPELSRFRLRGGWRLWDYVVQEGHGGRIDALEIPDGVRLIAVNRDEETMLAEPEVELEPGDVVLLLAPEDAVGGLETCFGAG